MRLTTSALCLTACLAVAASSCSNDVPGTALTREQLLDPRTCQSCHADHYNDWSQSMHAYASEDPVFLAMNQRAQRETNGAIGDFCVQCHAPMAVHEGVNTDPNSLASLPQSLKGVTCYFCHNIDAVQGTHNNPLHLADDTTMRGEYNNPTANKAHGSVYSNLIDRSEPQSATLCGSCHDVVAPPGGEVERTFAEWQHSAFSANQDGETCSQCHMSQSATQQLIAQAPNVKPRYFHSHNFPGVDVALTSFPGQSAQNANVQSFLNTSLQEAVCVKMVNGTASIRVRLDNVSAGHNWPSGAAQDRRAWAEVIAYKDNQVIYQSGVVADGNDVTQLNDPNLWLMHDCIFDANGNQVSMFWQTATTETNTLTGQLSFDQNDPNYYAGHVVQYFPRDTNSTLSQIPDSVTLRIRIQPIGVDILNDLVQSGDLDPNIVAQMPTFDVSPIDQVLTWTSSAAAANSYLENGVPVTCVTNGINMAATPTPATNHVLCDP